MRTHIVIPEDLVNQVDERVGPRGRSEFIAECVRREIRRLQLSEAFDRAVGSLRDVEIPGWESPEAADEWLREAREFEGAGGVSQ